MGRSPVLATCRVLVSSPTLASRSGALATMISPGIIKALANRMVDGDELRAVGKGSLHLHVVNHFSDAFHDVAALQNRRSKTHQLRHRSAVPRAFENFVGNDRDGFRVVELQPALLAAAGEIGGDDDEQFLLVPR